MRCLLSLSLTLAAAVGASPARAADPKVVAGTPPNASLFVYAEVAKLWASPYAESLRAAGTQELKDTLAPLDKMGVRLEDVKAVSLFIPAVEPGQEMRQFGFRAEFHQPYDRAKLLAGVAGRDAKLDAAGRYTSPGAIPLRFVRPANDPMNPGKFEPVPGAKPVGGFMLDFSDPLFVSYFSDMSPDVLKAAAAPGSMVAAIRAAESNQLVVAADRVLVAAATKGDFTGDLKPFAPLAEADLLLFTGKLAADGSMPLELRATSTDPAKAAAAGTALEGGLKVLSIVAGVTAAEPGKEYAMRDKMGALAPILKALAPALKTAAVKVDRTAAVATLALPADLPVGPAVAALINDRPPGMRPSNRTRTQNHLKQIALAMHNYSDVHGGFPAAAICDQAGKPLLSWRVAVLLYLGQEALYKQFRLNEPWDSDHNKTIAASNPMPAVYTVAGVTPAGAKTTPMQVFVGNGAMFEMTKPTKLAQIADGTVNTILVGIAAKPVDWTKPEDMPFDPKADPRPLLDLGKDGVSVAFADGSVRFLQPTLEANTLKAAITRGGGEVINLDEPEKPKAPAAEPKPRPNPFGKGDRAKAANNLKQLGLGMHNYHDANGQFPTAASMDKAGKPLLSWRVAVLPHLGQEAVYKKFKLDEPWDSTHNKKVLADHPMPAVFGLPGVTKPGDKTTPFQVFVGMGTMFDPALKGARITAVTDGTSNTVMVAVAATPVEWTRPADIPFDPAADPVKLLHAPALLLTADGAFHAPKALTADKLRAAITSAGGETLRLRD